ncbi:MAG TPA: hypothetical protein VD969_09550 [Symbiobacteriaceae bacterium]|nr:hypothetical protein [Symbiobacteriaceae bacterium]
MNELSIQMLTEIGARVTVLGLGRNALPVPFRVRAGAVECRVPSWFGVDDLLADVGEVTLVAVDEKGPSLRWLFIRGPASMVVNPDWGGLQLPELGSVGPNDLYQVLRVVPKRIELIDEQRGWGFRKTIDL